MTNCWLQRKIQRQTERNNEWEEARGSFGQKGQVRSRVRHEFISCLHFKERIQMMPKKRPSHETARPGQNRNLFPCSLVISVWTSAKLAFQIAPRFPSTCLNSACNLVQNHLKTKTMMRPECQSEQSKVHEKMIHRGWWRWKNLSIRDRTLTSTPLNTLEIYWNNDSSPDIQTFFSVDAPGQLGKFPQQYYKPRGTFTWGSESGGMIRRPQTFGRKI